MNDKASQALAWLAKAGSDLTAARRLLDLGGPYDAVCFHAQQAAEKALKALLALAGAPIARTHNLEDLQQQCLETFPSGALPGLRGEDLSQLTAFAVESRYDVEFWPTPSEAADAVAVATRIHAQAGAVISK